MKIFQKVVRAGAVSISLCVGVFSQVPPTSFIILNEIEVNNPGTDDPACEFIELRGDANTSVPGEIYLLEVEGDGTSAGTVDFARNINGQQLGPNGTVTFGGTSIVGAGDRGIPASVCGSRSYTDSGGIHVEDPNLTLENGTISFMLVAVEKSVIGVGDDIDTNDDGIIDNLPFDAMIIDAVGWSDGGVADFVYGGVNVTPGNTSGSPDGATRNFTNITELDPAAWFADDLASPGSVEAVLYDQNNLGG
ncbi:MAG: hypothetical protein OEM82_09820, partial [Acidobacteriota bacterium]|nr:hypothetical protein [Acidobacteriota bacterium]